MTIVMILWAILSVVSIVEICVRSWKQPFRWGEALFKLQSMAIGLLFFPFYWGVSETVEWVCLLTGIGLVTLYVGTLLWKTPKKEEEPKSPITNRLRR